MGQRSSSPAADPAPNVINCMAPPTKKIRPTIADRPPQEEKKGGRSPHPRHPKRHPPQSHRTFNPRPYQNTERATRGGTSPRPCLRLAPPQETRSPTKPPTSPAGADSRPDRPTRQPTRSLAPDFGGEPKVKGEKGATPHSTHQPGPPAAIEAGTASRGPRAKHVKIKARPAGPNRPVRSQVQKRHLAAARSLPEPSPEAPGED
ncbi:hypothetical protein NDU88_006183 [Pleurodeles waltl]|uniref:Uncharacterized protein n=1 Tax=Pleurodeles waltl TaxID=8319 RepID=A0AAV7VL68_PLEWA|nr:hypothetical protein NDU88_006183 [Pleurodeles waltl]